MTFSGSPNYDSLPTFSSKKSKESSNPPGPDILHNLFNQVEDTAVGLVTMPWHVGKGLASDAKTLATGGSNFKTDDALKGIVTTTWDDLKKRWSPLVKGDLPGFWDAVEEDPLGIILDVATVATAGAAGAGKAAQGAVAAGKGAEKAAFGFGRTNAQVAGLHPARTLTEEIAAVTARNVPEEFGETIAREQVKQRRGVVDTEGTVWEPDVANLKMGKKNVPIELARNPLVRARQRAGVAISNKIGDDIPIVRIAGSSARGARRENVIEQNRLRRDVAMRNKSAALALEKLRKEEGQAAVEGLTIANLAQQGVSPEMAAAYWAKRSNTAIKDSKRMLDDAPEGARVSPKRGPNQAVGGMRAAARSKRLQESDVMRYADEANWSPLFRDTMTALNELSRENTRLIWEAKGRPDLRARKDAGTDVELRDPDAPAPAADPEAAFEAFWEAVAQREFEFMMREADVRDAFVGSRVAEAGAEGKRILLDGEDIPEGIDAVDLARKMREIKPLGKYAFVRPHTSQVRTPKSISDRAKARSGKAGNPHEKHNTGYNFANAFDLFTPEGLLSVTEHVESFASAKRRLETLVQSGVRVKHGDRPPRGWVAIEDADAREYAQALGQFVDEDLAITFGDSPVVQQARTIAEQLAAKVDGDGALFVPPSVYKAFRAEVKSTNEFLKHYDNLTGFWRSWTLTMRPVWITGNFFGGILMLLATHGLAKSVAAYMQMWRMGARNSHLDQFAPDLLSAGLVRSALDDLMLENPSATFAESYAKHVDSQSRMPRTRAAFDKFGQLQTRIGNFNALVTDDAVRRASFWAEIKPQVREIQRKHPELSVDEAAGMLLSDPKIVDDVAQKVLGDLVNFRDLTETERNVVRRFVPFYSWIKGASGRSMRLAMDEPWKAWAAMQGAEWGTAQTEAEIGGELPDYLRGALTMGDVEDGSVRIVPTNALNPFATLGDVTGMAKAAVLGDNQVGGNNPASSTSPLVKSPIEAFANRDLFYGTPLDRTGRSSLLSRLGMQLYHSFPQTRYVEKALQDSGPLSGSKLYEPSGWDQLISYLAVPTKRLNVAEADERARAQDSGLGANLI